MTTFAEALAAVRTRYETVYAGIWSDRDRFVAQTMYDQLADDHAGRDEPRVTVVGTAQGSAIAFSAWQEATAEILKSEPHVFRAESLANYRLLLKEVLGKFKERKTGGGWTAYVNDQQMTEWRQQAGGEP